MDDSEKIINASIKYVWNNNHPNLKELISCNYMSLEDALRLYGEFFDRLLEIRSNFARNFDDSNDMRVQQAINTIREKVNSSTASEEEISKLKEYETRMEKLQKIYAKVDELLTIFPIIFENKDVLVSEHINGFMDKSVLSMRNHRSPYQSDVVGHYKLLNANNEILVDIDTKSDEEVANELIGILFYRCKVDKSSIPTYLENNELFKYKNYLMLSLDEEIEVFERDCELLLSEFNKMFEQNQKIIMASNSLDEKKFSEQRLQFKQQEEENKKKKIEELKIKMLQVLENMNELMGENNLRIQKYNIPEEVLFDIDENGIKHIDERFINYLKFIDISTINFDNADVRGIDFSNTNPNLLNPQTVFNKDLSNTVFINDPTNNNSVFPFGTHTSFEGVNLSGATIVSEEPLLINFNNAKGDSKTQVVINNQVIEIDQILDR